LSDAAHAESLDHEVYSKPFKVEPQFETIKTPGNYRRYPDGDKLPDQMKVWRVQDTGNRIGGVVAQPYGFTDSPDDEMLAVGVNTGKQYGAVCIGRHGNILMWGYSAPPSKMTEAGKKLFLNCICYIHKFDGKVPLIRRIAQHRLNTLRLAPGAERSLQRRRKENEKKFIPFIPDDITEKFLGDPNGFVQYYKDNIEFIYMDLDRQFRIDNELKSLVLKSNRKTETLEKLISLLEDEKNSDTARHLLARYTNKSFQNVEQWHSWFEENKDRIFFSDVGGFKFFIVPKGYLENKT
jgi:hypothetical protein